MHLKTAGSERESKLRVDESRSKENHVSKQLIHQSILPYPSIYSSTLTVYERTVNSIIFQQQNELNEKITEAEQNSALNSIEESEEKTQVAWLNSPVVIGKNDNQIAI